MRLNSSPFNDVALNDISPRETFEGIFGRFYQAQVTTRPEGTFIFLNQSVGIGREEDIFIIFDQQVQLRSSIQTGPFVNFYQEVQHTEPSKEIVTFNQKVTP